MAQDKTETPKTLLGALAEALPELGAAKKGNLNPHFKSKYADLGSVIEAIRPIAEHGLWFRQVSHDAESGVSIETFYIHDSGELSAGKVFVPADKNNAQGFGSAQTYARRYGLQMAFGLATEDDDGNAASKGQEGQSQRGAVSPPALINDSEWAELVQLIEVTKTDTKAVCEAYKVESLKQMTAEKFKDAVAILKDRLARMEKADA